MEWILLSLASALFLGVYDVAKKAAVKDNAVPPVLLLNVMTAAMIWTPLLCAARLSPQLAQNLTLSPLGWSDHGLLALKSILVGLSWTFAFFALKHLPISIASPIRATSPFWTIAIAVALFRERPTTLQWTGMAVVMLAFFAFSRSGKQEGIHFHKNRWVACMTVATLLGSISAIYDKYLLQAAGYSASTVQAWFSIYLVPTMVPLAVRWYLYERRSVRFQWRWSIPAIAVALLVADYLYFTTVSYPDAMISAISPTRRTSVVIPFVVGIVWFGERNWRRKAVCIACMLVGVYLLSSSH